MDYLKNHCWCSSSHWDGEVYYCQVIVSLDSYSDHTVDDWNSIMTTEEVHDSDMYKSMVMLFEDLGKPLEDLHKDMFIKDVPIPKPEVLDWLTENVPDRPDGTKGWCIGSEDYRAGDSCCSFSFFFQLRTDAMKFIKEFSKWKKPVRYTQYFTDVRKVLDLETLKYEEV